MPQGKNRGLTIVATAVIVAVFVAGDYWWPVMVAAQNRNIRTSLVNGVGPRNDSNLGNESEFFFPLIFVNLQALLLAAFGIGTLWAEAALLAVWAVFGRTNIVIRLACSLFAGLWTWYLLLCSPGSTLPPNGNAAIFGALLLSGIMLLQAAFWVIKLTFGIRMLAPDEPQAVPAPLRLQFRLKDLLIATLIVALAISPIRFFVLPESNFRERFVFVLVLGLMPFLVANLVATLPSLWAASGRTWRVAALAGYCLLLTAFELVNRHASKHLATFTLLNIAQCGVVYGVMRIYYVLGFRLRRVPRMRRATSGDEKGTPLISDDGNVAQKNSL
jgi:hypothetical protein